MGTAGASGDEGIMDEWRLAALRKAGKAVRYWLRTGRLPKGYERYGAMRAPRDVRHEAANPAGETTANVSRHTSSITAQVRLLPGNRLDQERAHGVPATTKNEKKPPKNPVLKGRKRRVWGSLRVYDPETEFGVVVPDDGSEELFLHRIVLQRSGFGAVFPGARILCDVLHGSHGPVVSHVHLMVLDRKSPDPAQNPSPLSPWESVRVKWYDSRRQQGYLTRCGKRGDVFVDGACLAANGIRELRPGQRFLVRHRKGPMGPTAEQLRPARLAPLGARRKSDMAPPLRQKAEMLPLPPKRKS